MRAALILVLSLLAGGGSHAGAMWRGVCYATTTAAAQAFCGDAVQPMAIGGSSTQDIQHTTTASVQRRTVAAGYVLPTCVITSVSGQVGTLRVGGFNSISTDHTSVQSTGTGYTYVPSLPTSHTFSGSYDNALMDRAVTFPSCTTGDWQDATVTDGVAVGTLAALPMFLAAVLMFMRRGLRR